MKRLLFYLFFAAYFSINAMEPPLRAITGNSNAPGDINVESGLSEPANPGLPNTLDGQEITSESVIPTNSSNQTATPKTVHEKLMAFLTFIPRNKRTSVKTILWESVFAAGLSIATFVAATEATGQEANIGMIVAAAYLNQAVEAPFCWTYEWLWKTYWPSKLLDGMATKSHIDQAADGPVGNSDAPHAIIVDAATKPTVIFDEPHKSSLEIANPMDS